MKIFVKKYLLTVLAFLAIQNAVFAQEKEIILVQGNPPLTQLMVGKVIVFLDWILELKMKQEQKIKIREILASEWKKKNTEAIKSTLDLISVYEEIVLMSEAERNQYKKKMKPDILQSLKQDQENELNALVIQAYNSLHGDSNDIRDSSKKIERGMDIQKTGTVGFSGIYRMVRPKALNMHNPGAESGFYIEHICFLPDGNLYWNLPPEGLLNFDFNLAQTAHSNDCGSYELKNGEIHILRGPQKTKYVITRNGERLNNPPSLGKGSFRPVPSLDNLKLEGNFRRNKTEHTLSFTKDGRFTDGGVFQFFGIITRQDGSSYKDDAKGGSGTYHIEQNTLELHYADGRIKRFAIEAFPENLKNAPAVDSFLLLGNRMEKY